ncbi:hypothetical protein HNR00_005090 [Methylorubrum rhodinum]|uniref:Uncharacterized protein n=1 Tax=Methylorubrum rhodinum TaxID=29428 RepID=A0A840ZU17_9HYPH|nr:hypothetical protein [Methylorubrum rhodinum]MBB5760341.1 hypothetical protein [Methylorubrum rhodinum]
MTIPGPSDIEAAWRGFPAETRDRIGIVALDMVFQAFVSGDGYAPADRPVQDEQLRYEANEACDRRLTQLHTEIEGALPDLFGPDGEHPAWSDSPGPQPRGAP